MQPSANLWTTLCEDLQAKRHSAHQEEYVRVAQEFVNLARQILRETSPRLGDACEIAGDICQETAARDEAITFYAEACEIAETSGNQASAGRVAGKLAEILDRPGEEHRAMEFYLRALNHFDELNDHSLHATLLSGLAAARSRIGDHDGARKAYEQAIEILTRLHGDKHPDLAVIYTNLGVCLSEVGDYPLAERAHLHALSLREAIYGSNHPEVAHSLTNLGVLNHSRGDQAQAARYYEAALQIYQHFADPEAREIQQLEAALGRLDALGN